MKLGNNIRRLRFEKSEMTQEELASKMGITRQSVYAIEKGKFIPSTFLALKMAQIFNTTVEDIFYVIDSKTHEN